MANKCVCEDYQKGIEALGAVSMMSHIHGLPYRGKPFNFCPWCGGTVESSKLTVSQKEMETISNLTKDKQMNNMGA